MIPAARSCALVLLLPTSCRGAEPKDSSRPPPLPSDTGRINRPPTVPDLAIEPDDPVTADDLSYRVEIPPTDPDGDALSWSISWAVDGVPAPEWTDTVSSEATHKGQVWELRATVTDGQFVSDTALEIAVIGNTPPTATVEITPATPTTLDSLRATASGSDVDGDTLGYTLVWLVNGINTGITDLEIPSSRTRAGESWSVVVTPADPDSTGEPTAASVAVVNSSPTITAIDIDPSRPETTDTLVSSFVGADADQEDILIPIYSWTVNGAEVGTGPELDSSSFVRGQEVGLSIALDDGTVEGPARFAEPVIIENSKPTIADAQLTPPGFGPTDTVTCSAAGWYDADSDLEGYTYIWSAAGMPGPSTAAWDLATAGVTSGDQVACTIVPFDGFDNGASITVTETVSPP